MRHLWRTSLVILSMFAQAEVGVTDSEIVIGQSAALSGAAAELGKGVSRGANAYFNEINKRGGVNGRKIRLVTLDDGYEPDRAVANTAKLLDKEQVFALLGYVGTPTSNASLPKIKEVGAPFIAPFTGAASLRAPFNRNIFNVRASYGDEADVIAKSIVNVGMKTVNILYQDDAYGAAGLKAMQEAAAKYKLTIGATATVKRNTVDVANAVEELIVKKPANAVFIVSAYKSSAAFITAARALNSVGPFYNLSFVGTEALVNELKNDARGVIVTQVVPSPYSAIKIVAQEYKKTMKAAGITSVDYPSMEGYIGARVLVEGLKRAGRELTRDKLVNALEGMSDYDLGGFKVNFTNSNHSGSRFIDITILDSTGKISS
ncbi:ABC transporter substrate-binding protein [Chitinimonas sp. PSY-7]|uniref:ABC transporter substrate-binding protein n=1 Tax=Chitinimonas sp. PSY-7 TaxID=3459088 RepID=UPI00404026B0